MNRPHTWEFLMDGNVVRFYSRARARSQRRNLMRRHSDRSFSAVRKANA